MARCVTGLLAGLLLGFAEPVVAASCSADSSGGDALLAGSPGDLDTSDMTFRGNPADGCSGLYVGNNSAAEVRAVALQLGSMLDPLQPELKADGAGMTGAALYDGILWTLSYQTSPEPDTWTLSYSSDPGLVRSYDLVAALKQATGWAVWRFADEVFATDGAGGGTFFIDWCKGSRNMTFDCSSDALSHMSVHFSPTSRQVPEPGPLLLVGAVMAFLLVSAQRRAKKQR